MCHNGQSQVINQTTKVGTPFYLAPEIWEGKPYTHKSDIWSLGVILFELCSLQKPFISDTMEGLKTKIVNEKPITSNGF
jgi:serine/threonine protein kinase